MVLTWEMFFGALLLLMTWEFLLVCLLVLDNVVVKCAHVNL